MVSSPEGVVEMPLAGTRMNKAYPSASSNLSIAAVIEDWEMFNSSAAFAIDPLRAAASM